MLDDQAEATACRRHADLRQEAGPTRAAGEYGGSYTVDCLMDSTTMYLATKRFMLDCVGNYRGVSGASASGSKWSHSPSTPISPTTRLPRPAVPSGLPPVT